MDHFNIQPLDLSKRDELLAFFDRAFEDNPKWGGCYCHCFYADHSVVDWPSRKPEENRAATFALIGQGKMMGWIAHAQGMAIGWCNAAPKSWVTAVRDEPDPYEDCEMTGFISCFLVHPAWRGRGVAKALLEAACVGLASCGLVVAEANPRLEAQSAADNHFGPLSMYLSAGFVVDRTDTDGSVYVRRTLQSHARS